VATQTIQTAVRPGINLTTLAVVADAGLTDTWANTGSQLVAVINGGGAPITVTENYGAGAKFDGTSPASPTYSVPAGQTCILGPFRTDYFNTAAGTASISYSAVTSVKIMVFQPGNS
jgi:hypothetical protein